MSSTNEELPPPPKPRTSPLDYRNTDLVSRLLAATPPYLYNSPMIPHTYFFSEMLRSFVQAKNQEQNRNVNPPTTSISPPINPNVINTVNTNNNLISHRRSRKRAWNNQLKPTAPSPPEMWSPTAKDEVWSPGKEQKISPNPEKPLELTINKINKITHKISDLEKSSVPKTEETETPQIFSNNPALNEPAPPNDLILPPPPPIWYPPIYPTPYGIDPFHFFIDLRVSGHIYDRKKEQNFLPPDIKTPPELFAENNNNAPFKQTRHTSAFSVPVRNGPINLSNGLKEDVKPEENKDSNFRNSQENRAENLINTNQSQQELDAPPPSTENEIEPRMIYNGVDKNASENKASDQFTSDKTSMDCDECNDALNESMQITEDVQNIMEPCEVEDANAF